MKRNKVLLGLYVGLLTLAGGVVNAQTGTSDGKFYEIGPSNVGGAVSSLVVDCKDASRTTIYAGATTGGLFVKSSNVEILRNLYVKLGMDERLAEDTAIWHHVPFYDNSGREVSLPISCMTQDPDGNIYIGTGSDDYNYGSTYGRMSRKGKGIFRYNPAENKFDTIFTASGKIFNVVKDIEYIYRNNTLYLYVATSEGLYRLVHLEGTTWAPINDADPVFPGNVDEMVIARGRNIAFFSSGNQLWRLGQVATNGELTPINVSASNSAFGGTNTRIKLAVSQGSDTTFLYAMVIDQTGYMEGLYVTNNEQTWNVVTTSSVMPIIYNSGLNCGAIAIDPLNPRRVVIGGTNIMVGVGYVDGSYYQWTTASASEQQLNYGDYMGMVFSNSSFVHSGIHQIIPVWRIKDGVGYHTYYIATDGGVYSSIRNFSSENDLAGFRGENQGLNNVQLNGLAVCPDGTLISGANNNACPIIEAHLDHNITDPTFYRNQNYSWFDDCSRYLNHEANILWSGNGGAVAASAFQQVNPLSRRTIFTSAENANIGRSYADYLDYTNTTTWTSGQGFMTNEINGGPAIGSISLWETDTNTVFNGMVKMGVDTLGYILRKLNATNPNYDTVWLALPGTDSAVVIVRADTSINNDTIGVGTGRGSSFKMKRGDKAVFFSRANADYPFEYEYTSNNLYARDTVSVVNPIRSHMLAIASRSISSVSQDVPPVMGVWFSWAPTDFTKVWDSAEYRDGFTTQGLHEKLHFWSPIYTISRVSGTPSANYYPRHAVFSRDGLYAYVSVYDIENHRSMLLRLKGFKNIDFTQDNYTIRESVSVDKGSSSLIKVDTLRVGGNAWFPRAISSITVDGRNGQDRLVLTFEDDTNSYANVALVKNASKSSYIIEPIALGNSSMPAYCALVEDSTGNIYVGAEEGVYVRGNNGAWTVYNKLTGVPVTSIVQQTRKLPVRHNLTHTGITANHYAFAKTKWPRAIYFGTYGRGIFMDMEYVTDFENEVVNPEDYNPVDIPTVHATGAGSLNLYPNPVYGEANIALNAEVAGNAVLRVYDLSGRLVVNRNLGHVTEGEHLYTIDCTGMSKGMYLINVIIGGHTATAKMMVR
ncbi:MAG: T9SS type A sorting domain-containing protein [bacterium]